VLAISCNDTVSQMDSHGYADSLDMQHDTNKLKTVSIAPGEKFLWKTGLCLKATEASVFYIPGAIFPNNVKIGQILQSSDTNLGIEFISRPKVGDSTMPDFRVFLKKGVTLKINRNTEVIFTKDDNPGEKNRVFIIEEGELETDIHHK